MGMFDAARLTLEARLALVDRLCDLIHGRYRGRATSGIRSWVRADPAVLAQVGVPVPPPDLAAWWRALYDKVDGLKLSTQRDKRVLAGMVRQLAGGDEAEGAAWALRLIPEVSHAEFGHFIVTGAVLARDRAWERAGVVELKEEAPEARLPTLALLRDIGVFDCHAGRRWGGFEEFIRKGMVVTPEAPVADLVGGHSMIELTEFYSKVKAVTGSKRFR